METWAGLRPGLHLSLGIWMMIAALTLQNAKAEIICASCPSPVQLRLENSQQDIRTDLTEEPSTLKDIRVELKELEDADHNTGVDGDHKTGVPGDAPLFFQDVSLDRVTTKEDPSGSSRESHSGSVKRGRKPRVMGEDATLRREKRSGPEFVELRESRWAGRTGVEAGAPGNRGSLLDGQKQGMSDFRWSRDEEKGNTRQDDPKITSSTFALTGDSAHNHAVVYWSGQNSSVSNHASVLCPALFRD